MGKLKVSGRASEPHPGMEWAMSGVVVVNITTDGRTVIMVKNEFAAQVDLEQLDNLCAAMKETIIKVAGRVRRPVIELATEMPPKLPNVQ